MSIDAAWRARVIAKELLRAAAAHQDDGDIAAELRAIAGQIDGRPPTGHDPRAGTETR